MIKGFKGFFRDLEGDRLGFVSLFASLNSMTFHNLTFSYHFLTFSKLFSCFDLQ